MRLKERMKTYNFWVSLASAMLLIINTLGKKFDFSVDEKMYNDLLSSFCGILVLLGIIVPPSNSEKLISSKSNKNITIEIFDDESTEINLEKIENDEEIENSELNDVIQEEGEIHKK